MGRARLCEYPTSALAPDAFVHLRDGNERGLLAFVELDLRRTSHARLKAKASGYAAHLPGPTRTRLDTYDAGLRLLVADG